MPEQSVHHQRENDLNQQLTTTMNYKEKKYENNRHDRSGRIQRRNRT